MPAGVPVANTYEHETSIAEYVLAGMLEWQIGLRAMDAEFRAHGWAGRMPGDAPLHRELRGLTLGIVGHGHIGREAALRARAFGMRCIGIRRSARALPARARLAGSARPARRLLGESDFVLIACDMNDETRGLIDAARLAAMKPTGVLINVARGRIVDEDALWDALSAGRIGGAILDVWYNYNQPDKPEVRPSNRPFETLDNVLLSAPPERAHRGDARAPLALRRRELRPDRPRRAAAERRLHRHRRCCGGRAHEHHRSWRGEGSARPAGWSQPGQRPGGPRSCLSRKAGRDAPTGQSTAFGSGSRPPRRCCRPCSRRSCAASAAARYSRRSRSASTSGCRGRAACPRPSGAGTGGPGRSACSNSSASSASLSAWPAAR